ncbi:hypothetical protein ACVWZ6_007366 [Bradyrhizobium sp. GM6.1]
MRDVALDGDLDLMVLAFACERAAGEAAAALFDAVIDRGMECNSHGSILLGVTLFELEHDD